MSINNDDTGSSEESDNETSNLLGSGPKAFREPRHYGLQGSNIIPDPHGNTVEVEVEDVHDGPHNQHSIITIFSMWNTMMGTSLLSMPWAIKQAGFVNGIVLLVVMAGIMAYTSYRVLTLGRSIASNVLSEFSDVVRFYLGRVAEMVTILCSLLTLVGGCIVYWILMSNFLYQIGVFVYSHVNSEPPNPPNASFSDLHGILEKYSDVTCDNLTSVSGKETTFDKIWNETKTIPFFLVCLLFPLLNFKSPTFFTKFNAVGTLSVLYLTVFVAVKASQWKINMTLDFSDTTSLDNLTPAFEWSFPALTGVAALAYFLQNAVIAIVRNQKHPENNTRDLIIAYILVCITYTYMGSVFYAAFPLDKSCIEDNFLNNISSTDIMAFIARICLFIQMTCVLPLLTFIIRAQLLQFIFRSIWPSVKHVLLLNIAIVALCVVFAVFLPKIGHIISFVGAFCGFSYAIALPCLSYIMACRREGTLSPLKIAVHAVLIFIGLANFVAQFVIIGHTQ